MGRPKIYATKAEKVKAWKLRNRESWTLKQRDYNKQYAIRHRTDRGRLILENRELVKKNKRRCTKCNEIKLLHFYNTKESVCKECQNLYKRLSYKSKKQYVKMNPLTSKLRNCVSTNIRQSLKGNKNRRRWECLVGYTIDELMGHLEKLFKPGMTWENQGSEWHIDHIIPVSVFNFTTYTDLDFKKCWALSNLRPLWAKENISKGAKLLKPFQPSLALGI